MATQTGETKKKGRRENQRVSKIGAEGLKRERCKGIYLSPTSSTVGQCRGGRLFVFSGSGFAQMMKLFMTAIPHDRSDDGDAPTVNLTVTGWKFT